MSTANSLQTIEFQLNHAIQLCNDYLKKPQISYENIELELSSEEFLRLAKRAHEEDITFNQLVNKILLEHIEKETENDKNGINS